MAQVQKMERTIPSSSHQSTSLQFKAKSSSGYYQPELLLDRNLILADLRKTTIVTLLAIGVQIVLFLYLRNGGWSRLLGIFS